MVTHLREDMSCPSDCGLGVFDCVVKGSARIAHFMLNGNVKHWTVLVNFFLKLWMIRLSRHVYFVCSTIHSTLAQLEVEYTHS